MKSKEELLALFHRFLEGVYTSSELDELLNLFAIKDGNEAQLKEIITAYIASPEQFDEATLARAENITRQTDRYLDKLIHEQQPITKSMVNWKRYLAIAAISLSLLTSGIWLYQYSQQAVIDNQLTSQYGDDVLPGGNRASLLLSDGTSIALDEAKQGIITNGEQVVYDDGASVSEHIHGAEYATLITPRGGQYQITLSDGTEVWLNAESSLRYPASFQGKERRVELIGEGYFDVTPDETKPFIVSSEGQEVAVLGTEFNINSYKQPASIVTTLVEGRVLIQHAHGKQQQLQPSEQAIVSKDGITITKVSIGDYTAWKNGEFVFYYSSLTDILNELERWYDIDVDFQTIPNKTFYAAIKRDVPLSEVLDLIAAAGDLQFEISGRRLTVKKR